MLHWLQSQDTIDELVTVDDPNTSDRPISKPSIFMLPLENASPKRIFPAPTCAKYAYEMK